MVALGALCVVYAALGALPAAPGSRLILATAGGSPSWLLGPLRPFGLGAASGPLAGPLFYAGLWLALVGYVVVLARARKLSPRVALGAVVGLHVLFLLAPPLLSQDVFSYVAYARLGALHGIDPYTSGPLAAPGDPVLAFAGSKATPSVYGPAFTLAAYALAGVSVPVALWVLKAVAALASLGAVALVWRAAERRGRDPVPAALFLGLNPVLLVHVIAGAHNDALVMVLAAAAASMLSAEEGRVATARTGLPAALATATACVKASGAVLVPFFVLGDRRPVRGVLAALAVALTAAAVSLAVFGPDALAWVGSLRANQTHASSLSLPSLTAKLLAALLPGGAAEFLPGVRAAYAAVFAIVLAWLLIRTRRGADPIAMAGWATLALLLCSAWLVPWYLAWLLPLVALAASRRLVAATVVLTAWTLAIAIPF